MLQPTVRRTWAPRGCTPVHQSWDRHDRFSTHGAITISPKRTRLGFYFRLQESNVTAEDVIDFVRQVRRQVGWKRLLIVWDRLNAHRKAQRLMQEIYGDDVQFEYLPAYAPDCNPVDKSWAHTKYGMLANFLPDDAEHLRGVVENTLASKHGDQQLLRSFFKQAFLTL